MARLFSTGFETGEREWNSSFSTLSFDNTVYRTGHYSLRFDCSSILDSYFRHVFEDNKTDLYWRFAIRCSSAFLANGDTQLLTIYDHNLAPQIKIGFQQGTNTFYLALGNGTVLASGNIVIEVDTWYVVEIHMTCATISGRVTLKVNSATDFSYLGDTDYTNTGTFRSFQFFSPSGGISTDPVIYLDDVAVNDTVGPYQDSWIGLGGVFFLKPTADGAHTDWTPSEGSDHYDDVDETPPKTTDWVQGISVGEIDTYVIEDCPPYVAVINLVEVLYRAAVITSGSNTLEDVVRQGGVDYNGVSHVVVPIIPSYTLYKGETHYVQPDGSGPWSIADVDALEVGMEIVA